MAKPVFFEIERFARVRDPTVRPISSGPLGFLNPRPEPTVVKQEPIAMTRKSNASFTCWICFPLICLLPASNCAAQQFGVPQNSNARGGAVLGGVTGAIIGGIAGNQNDETPEGILIGGAVGALAGGLLGKAEDNRVIQQQQYQQQAQAAYQHRLGRAVSIEDAIVLTRSGVSPQLIQNQIYEHGVTHSVTVNDIVHLHNSGVSEAVITSMQEARLASQVPVVNTPVVRTPSPVVVRPAPAIVVRPAPAIGLQIYSKPRYSQSRPAYRPKPVYKPRPGGYPGGYYRRGR